MRAAGSGKGAGADAARSERLHQALKQHFGYDTFRPLQEEIIVDALEGRDVFALLPTGGGKSLCYQLPAVAREGLTIVISPLIALMKDQVDGLSAVGIPATFLNSTLTSAEAKARFAALYRGEMRLLYVAPERLMLSGFLEAVSNWNVTQIAVDEAHCISEWGHDFRPEYRRLAELRDLFPKVPIMALTATATERVRADIVHQMRLREPQCYVASFNRPNLSYRVIPKEGGSRQTLQVIRERPGESGIIYCQSRKGVEALAEFLTGQGVKALPYHAGLEAEARRKHQELFIRDQAQVICATIAFGMGINKPNVRFVIHHDLPKNIEGYYQETGRAGRDGLPSDCLLLFSPADVLKQRNFIEEKEPEEQQIAREQLAQMVHFAEDGSCRRVFLLGYFGEKYEEANCGACDNCLAPRESFDGTIAAQKLLSCVYRLREMSGFAVGLAHVVEVLTGAKSEKIRKWGHDKVSTYGIGQEHSRSEWSAIGRELIRLGFCRQDPARFNVLELTAEGMAALRNRSPISLTRPMQAPAGRRPKQGEIGCDEKLFARLRVTRKQLADELDVPAYVVFSDVTLRLMARLYPQTERELLGISGVGEKKAREYGDAFLEIIRSHLQTNPREVFSDSLEPVAPRGLKNRR